MNSREIKIRDEQIVKLFQNHNCAEIGNQLGLTRERVRQIIVNKGLISKVQQKLVTELFFLI